MNYNFNRRRSVSVPSLIDLSRLSAFQQGGGENENEIDNININNNNNAAAIGVSDNELFPTVTLDELGMTEAQSTDVFASLDLMGGTAYGHNDASENLFRFDSTVQSAGDLDILFPIGPVAKRKNSINNPHNVPRLSGTFEGMELKRRVLERIYDSAGELNSFSTSIPFADSKRSTIGGFQFSNGCPIHKSRSEETIDRLTAGHDVKSMLQRSVSMGPQSSLSSFAMTATPSPIDNSMTTGNVVVSEKPVDPKRALHQISEQRRRQNMRDALIELSSNIPGTNTMKRLQAIHRASDYIKFLKKNLEKSREENKRMREVIQNAILNGADVAGFSVLAEQEESASFIFNAESHKPEPAKKKK